MKNRLLLILCLAVWPVIGTAQLDKTRTWVFGTGIKMKFLQNDSIEIDTIGIDCQLHCNSVWNDRLGNLLYATDCCRLYDSTGEYTGVKVDGQGLASQATIITSVDDSILHCFGTNPDLAYTWKGVRYGGYTHNTFDMKSGQWLIKTKKLLPVSATCQAIANHQNGKWQWVVCHSRLGDTLYSYLITENGLEAVPVQSFAGHFFRVPADGFGVMKFSTDGRYLIFTTWAGGYITFCHFNNQTGQIKEAFRMYAGDFNPYGLEVLEDNIFVSSFSPDGIYQYSTRQMTASAIKASRRTLFDSTDIAPLLGPNYGGEKLLGHLQRAPDRNIYIGTKNRQFLGKLSWQDTSDWQFSFTPKLFSNDSSYWGFPNFNASYFHTPSLNFGYTRNCKTNDFHFVAFDTFAASSWTWQFTKRDSTLFGYGQSCDFVFPDTGHWLVRCIAANAFRSDTTTKTIFILPPLASGFLGNDRIVHPDFPINDTLLGPGGMHSVRWNRVSDTAEYLEQNHPFFDTGFYLCQATNSVFCSYTDTIRVAYCDSIANAAVIQRIGDSLVTHTYAAKYQWYLETPSGDSAIIGATTNRLKLSSPGTYKLRTWNAIGCDSTSQSVTIEKCDSSIHTAIIQRSGDSLFTLTYAAKYQWYRVTPSGDSAIEGATTNKLLVASVGTYRLRTWNIFDCDSISEPFTVKTLGIQYENRGGFSIFPNPNHGEFVLSSILIPIQTVAVYSLSGDLVAEYHLPNQLSTTLQLNLVSGMYQIQINETHWLKLVVRQ
jgi:hypothetical protein